jgi:putative transposase
VAYRHNKAEIYLHFVWATRLREPWITPEIERAVHRCIDGEAQRLGCSVLALNGMPDHVHLLVMVATRLSAAELMKQVKGVSSRFVNDALPGQEGFRWQEGYGVFSVSRSHVQRVVGYIQNQKQHHESGTLWPEWEQTDETSPP